MVTGATGLIGSNLLPRLQCDWQVFGVSRRQLSEDFDRGRVHHIAVDLSKTWDTKAFPSRVDAVIHLAQSEHYRDFPERAVDVFQVNTVSTLRMLDYARRAGASTFVLASSGGVYGHHEQEFTEDLEISATGDLGFYLCTKLCAEVLMENYSAFFNVIVLRFFFVYGPGQRRSMLIPRLVRSVLEEKPITLQGRDGIQINPTYISDAVTAIYRSLRLKGSQKINVAGPEVLSLRRVGEVIGKILGKKPKFHLQPEMGPRHLIGNIRKMSEVLGPPLVGFEDGIRRYLKKT